MIKRIILFIKQHYLLLGILILAAGIRLYKIDQYMTFLGDEGRDAIALYNITRGVGDLFQGNFSLAKEHLTLLGPTASVGGFFMGPAYFYLVTPFYALFNYSPVGPSVFIALLSTLTVLLLYVIGAEFFNKKAGLIAALFYALSPLVIIYSRSSWNPNAMPFFTLLTLYCLYKAVRHNKLLLFFLSGILFGIDLQLHYIELAVGLIIITYVISMAVYKIKHIFSLQLILRVIAQGGAILGGFLVGFSAFIAFEVLHQFVNTKSIISFIFTSGETGASTNYFFSIWNVFVRLFSRLLINFPLPQDFKFYSDSVLNIWYAAGVAIALISLGYFLFQIKQSFNKQEKFLQMALLGIWLGIGILFFGFYKKPIYDYYFAFLFPLPFLLFGAVLSAIYDAKLLGKKSKLLQYTLKGIFCSIIVAILIIFYQFSPIKAAPNIQLQKNRRNSRFCVK